MEENNSVLATIEAETYQYQQKECSTNGRVKTNFGDRIIKNHFDTMFLTKKSKTNGRM